MSSMQYPSDIKPLTGLRFIAAFWILMYFFWNRLGFGESFFPGIVHMGYLGVDLFFILSGFVLAHVYGPQLENKSFKFGSFIWARLARVYPVHILTLAIIFVLWIAAQKMGAEVPTHAFNLNHIPFHLMLMQAWGFVDADGWNFPSWSISAEWFAYLSFPALFAVSTIFKKHRLLGIVFGIFSFYAIYWIAFMLGFDLVKMTWQGGALRIIPSFLTGIMLWRFGNNINLGFKAAYLGLALSALLLIVFASLSYSALVIWPCLLGVVFFLAETSKTKGKSLISSKTWVYLGEISFSMYMVHLLVDIVFFKIAEKLFPVQSFIIKLSLFSVAFILTIVAAAMLFELVEKPMRNYMRKNTPKFLTH